MFRPWERRGKVWASVVSTGGGGSQRACLSVLWDISWPGEISSQIGQVEALEDYLVHCTEGLNVSPTVFYTSSFGHESTPHNAQIN